MSNALVHSYVDIVTSRCFVFRAEARRRQNHSTCETDCLHIGRIRQTATWSSHTNESTFSATNIVMVSETQTTLSRSLTATMG